MKKCTKCEFMTPNKDYNICPICGEKLDIYKGKQKFSMGLSGEDSFTAEIEMTYEEALTVERVIEELMEHKPNGYWCGNVWIQEIMK